MSSETDTIIIGAGPAGLAVGAVLRRANVPFVMLERGQGSEAGAPGLYFCGYGAARAGLLRQIGIEARAIGRDIAAATGGARAALDPP